MAHLWLIGMMGSGKSAVGRHLAGRRGVAFYDVDQVIESAVGMTIRQVFDSQGEERFRDFEAEAICAIASAPAGVVATGGGAVLRDENVETMRESGTIVLLRAAPTELASRLADSTDRPLLAGGDRAARIEQLLETRAAAYGRAADVTVDTDGLQPADIADRIEETCAT